MLELINPHLNIAQNAMPRLPKYPLGTDSLKAVRIPGKETTQINVKPVIRNRNSPNFSAVSAFAMRYSKTKPERDAIICVRVNQDAP